MWLDILYEPGMIAVTNYTNGIKGEVSVLETTGEAVELKTTIENAETDRDDVTIVTVEAVDSEGRRVPYCDWKVMCRTEENTELVGFGTGNPISEENYSSDYCTLYEGRALLVLRKKNKEYDQMDRPPRHLPFPLMFGGGTGDKYDDPVEENVLGRKQNNMKVVIAIDSFKGSMSSIEAGNAGKGGDFLYKSKIRMTAVSNMIKTFLKSYRGIF